MLWFAPDQLGRTTELAQSSDLATALAAAFTDDDATIDRSDAELRAHLVIRLVVSFLAAPAADPAEERRLVERLVAPALVGPAVR